MYNLVTQPWLWTTDSGEVSLRDALVNAHKISGLLQGATSMMVAAQHRVLLAVLHRAIDGPRGIDQWAEIWQRGRFPQRQVEDYLAEWEEYFELYGSLEMPGFMQAIPPIPKVSERDVNKMVMHARAGGNVCLFGDGKPMILDPARAARNLVTIQAFALGGGSSGLPGRNFVDGPCARGIVFLLLGDNLFETLMLNLLPHPETGVRGVSGALESDKPIWEQLYPFGRDPLTSKRRKWSPRGMTDLYTWPSRRVVLIPSKDSLMTVRMQFSCGLYLGQYKDPQQYYPRKRALRLSVSDKKGAGTTGFDLAPAVLDEENRIAAAGWVDRLRDAGCDVEPRAVAAFGQASNLGAVLEEKAFVFPFPVTEEDRERALLALQDTKTAEGKLWAGLGRARALRSNGSAGRDTDLSSVTIPPGWREGFRQRLEENFCDLMRGEIEAAAYLQRVADVASQTYSEQTAMYPALAVVAGEGLLRGGLRKAGIIKSSEKEDKEED